MWWELSAQVDAFSFPQYGNASSTSPAPGDEVQVDSIVPCTNKVALIETLQMRLASIEAQMVLSRKELAETNALVSQLVGEMLGEHSSSKPHSLGDMTVESPIVHLTW